MFVLCKGDRPIQVLSEELCNVDKWLSKRYKRINLVYNPFPTGNDTTAILLSHFIYTFSILNGIVSIVWYLFSKLQYEKQYNQTKSTCNNYQEYSEWLHSPLSFVSMTKLLFFGVKCSNST